MVKNIVKEMIIILLLSLAIILILGVILYDYVPVNKPIPERISYTTPEKVKSELETDSNIDDMEVVITYEIDSTDLNNYKKIQEYVPGKKNPFSSINTEPTNATNGENTTGNTINNETSSASNSTNNSSLNESTGYLPDRGTK